MSKLIVFVTLLSLSLTTFANGEVIKGEYIVKLKKGVRAGSIFMQRNVSSLFEKKAPINGTRGQFVRVKVKPNMRNGLRSLANNPMVEYIEPNYRIRVPKVGKRRFTAAPMTPIDKMYPKLWGLNNKLGFDVDAPEAWKVTKGSKKVVVAVIDTGIDYNHPDLKGNLWINSKEKNGEPGVDDDGNGYVDDIYGYNFQKHNGDPMDDHGHGTHCAGTIGATHNSIGVAGVASRVRMMGLKFLGANGGSTAGAIESIYYAANNGAHIMSNSWGGGGKSQALKDAISYANDKGIIFTAAAGNSNSNNDTRPTYPANYKVDNVISVAAYDIKGKRAYFSNYGKNNVHVAAPGVDILSTVVGGGYKSFSGTSMATPHVTGVIALMLSLNAKKWINHRGSQRNTNVNPKTIKDLLINSSTEVEGLEDVTVSGGRVSADRFIKASIEASRR